MKIVKKVNGNIVILNTDATVKAVIQQTGLQMLLEGEDIKIIQSGYPIAYIKASEVTHTQIEPAAQVAFNGDNSALMTLLAEDLFDLQNVASMQADITTLQSDVTTLQGDVTAIQNEWTEVEVDVSSPEILAMGTTPVEILPAPGAGNYYKYEGIAEYTFNTTSYTWPLVGIVGATSYMGAYIIPSTILYSEDRAIPFNSSNPIYLDTVEINSLANGGFIKNEAIVLTTYDSSNPTLGDGTLKIKIKYKVETFG